MKKKNDIANKKSGKFKNAPFKPLQGLTRQHTPEKTKLFSKQHHHNTCTEDDANLFFRAMANVKRFNAANDQIIVSTKLPVRENPVNVALKDEQLFLQAVQQISTSFHKDVSDKGNEVAEHISLTSRMRQLKRGTVRISQELDLHGYLKEEAIRRLERFISNAFSTSQNAVLVITGKGNNSPDGPVLRRAVVHWLQDKGKRMIAEFSSAPRHRGGTGAFVIFLKRNIDNMGKK
ncbi:MAG TPA: Smr/MutS family protein [Nitrospirota bacterium]|nr:Smr/MutS family protein [Nitrospirota bacterium]